MYNLNLLNFLESTNEFKLKVYEINSSVQAQTTLKKKKICRLHNFIQGVKTLWYMLQKTSSRAISSESRPIGLFNPRFVQTDTSIPDTADSTEI